MTLRKHKNNSPWLTFAFQLILPHLTLWCNWHLLRCGSTLLFFFMWLDSLIKHRRVNNLSPIPDSLFSGNTHVPCLCLYSMDLPSCEPSCTILTFNSFQNIWIPSRAASHELLLCLLTPRLFSLWGISLTCLNFRMCVSMLVCLKKIWLPFFIDRALCFRLISGTCCFYDTECS